MNGSKEEAHQGLEMVLSFTCCEVGQLTKLLQAYLTQTLKLGQQLHHLHPEGGLQTASESALECLGNTSSHETCSSQAHVWKAASAPTLLPDRDCPGPVSNPWLWDKRWTETIWFHFWCNSPVGAERVKVDCGDSQTAWIEHCQVKVACLYA